MHGHKKRYKLDEIEYMANSIGLEVISNMYIFHTLYFFTVIWLKFFNKRPTIIKPPTHYMKVIHYIISKILFFEPKLVPNTWFGSSIISILKVNHKM